MTESGQDRITHLDFEVGVLYTKIEQLEHRYEHAAASTLRARARTLDEELGELLEIESGKPTRYRKPLLQRRSLLTEQQRWAADPRSTSEIEGCL